MDKTEPGEFGSYRECYDNNPLPFCIVDAVRNDTKKLADLQFVYLKLF